jgi:hypothetical protein
LASRPKRLIPCSGAACRQPARDGRQGLVQPGRAAFPRDGLRTARASLLPGDGKSAEGVAAFNKMAAFNEGRPIAFAADAIAFDGGLKLKNATASASGAKEGPGRGLRQKSGLNRSVLRQGKGVFPRHAGMEAFRPQRQDRRGRSRERRSRMPCLRACKQGRPP